MLLSDYITTALNEIQQGAKAAKWNAQILNNAGPGCPVGITFDVPIMQHNTPIISGEGRDQITTDSINLHVAEPAESGGDDQFCWPVLRFTLLVN